MVFLLCSLLGDSTDERPPSHSLFTIEYYQRFFNVDTTMVVDRIASSMIPKRAPVNYLKQHIGTNPDLYGPFWIVVTLVISFRWNLIDNSKKRKYKYFPCRSFRSRLAVILPVIYKKLQIIMPGVTISIWCPLPVQLL